MPSHNTYHLTWVSLTFDDWYLVTATPPDLVRGLAPLSPPAPARPPLHGHGVVPHIHSKNYILIIIAALFLIIKTWEKLRCPSANH